MMEGGLHNGVTAWWAAENARDGAHTYEHAMWRGGGAARLRNCSGTCLCAERRVLAAILRDPPGLPGFGASVVPEATVGRPDRLRQRIETAARNRHPLVWFGDGREGILRGEESSCVTADLWDGLGNRTDVLLPYEQVRRGRVYRMTRSPELRGASSEQTALALANWVADLLRPPVYAACPTRPIFATHGYGLSAVDAWYTQLTGDDVASPLHRDVVTQRLVWWHDALLAARNQIERLAGRQRTPLAIRLRRTADSLGACRLVADHPAGAPRYALDDGPEVRPWLIGMLAEAREAIEAAIGHAQEALVIAMRLPVQLADPLFAVHSEPPAGIHLAEMLYVARAGIAPLRMLAARRLAHAPSSRARSTLEQLLYDPDSAVAEMAIWALQQPAHHAHAPVFATAFRRAAPTRFRAELPLQISLLTAAVAAGGRAAAELLQSIGDDPGSDPTGISEEVRLWARRLKAEPVAARRSR